MKTTSPGHSMQKEKNNAFTDENLWVLRTMRYYILKTEPNRRSRKILVSYKTFKEIITSTVDRWLKQVLDRSGIDSKLLQLILSEVHPLQLDRNESGRFGALKSDSTHHFVRNACTKSGSLRFSQFSGC